MSQVWETAPYAGTPLVILLALADQMKDDEPCWPSLGTLARKARCSERNVQRTLERLERDGWLRREERPGRSSRYWVVTPHASVTPDASVTHPRRGRHPEP